MFFPSKNTYADNEIAKITFKLQDMEPDSEKYDALLGRLERLDKIRQNEKPDTVTSDTLVICAANLIGILLIIRHENVNVISTKAMSMLPRPR